MCLPIRLPANGLLSLTHVFLFLFTKFKLRDAQFARAYIYRYFLCTMILCTMIGHNNIYYIYIALYTYIENTVYLSIYKMCVQNNSALCTLYSVHNTHCI